MNLEFNWNNQIIRCKLEKINLFYGGNSSGKSELAQLFEDGFSGQLQDFEIDHQLVKKKEYEAIQCTDSYSLVEEFKLTSKTILAKEIKKIVSDSDFNENLNEQLLKAVQQLNDKLNERWEELGLNDSILFQGQFDFGDLTKFIKNQYQFYDDKINKVESKIKYYQLCAKYLSKQKKGVLIIDDFDNCLDLMNCLLMLEFFDNLDVTVFLFVKSAELCTYCINKYPIFLLTKNLKEYNEYYKSSIQSFTIEENLKNDIIYTSEDEIEYNIIYYNLYHQSILQTLSYKEKDGAKFLNFNFFLPDFWGKYQKNEK